ncbi:MAG TPA: HPr kinase/phosphatase C-terminal domain-containing protein [Allosphingosinicella sp.]
MSDPGATLHASCVSIGGRAVLLTGPSGSGKSDLAVRLIDRGAKLVSDDYTQVQLIEGRVLARAPERIAGKIELRGVGIVELPTAADVPVCLVADLSQAPERLPETRTTGIAGAKIPLVALAALEASAPLKLEHALQRFGLPLL